MGTRLHVERKRETRKGVGTCIVSLKVESRTFEDGATRAHGGISPISAQTGSTLSGGNLEDNLGSKQKRIIL